MGLSSFADGHLWGARYGSGRPRILALHGWRRDHHDFDAVLSGLDAIALDLPGFGAAKEPPAPWSSRDFAEQVAPVLSEMAPGQVVLVGHSFGARVAVHLAGLSSAGLSSAGLPSAGLPSAAQSEPAGPGKSGRVGTLVLTGAPLAPFPGRRAPRRPPLGFRAGRALHRLGVLPDARMERLRGKYGSEDYRQASPVMRGVLVKAVAETAGAAYVPLLRDWLVAGGDLELVWGEADEVASLEGASLGLAGAQAPAGVPPVPGGHAQVTTTVVPGAGHLLNAALAAAVRAAVLRHLPEAAVETAACTR
ncbi:MAG TPA: alpha/beta fold hydrolase [Acidimicrobiales bacterium]|nr:alpha/beta fold hydrolase [Acidimicrobiales bacterium]